MIHDGSPAVLDLFPQRTSGQPCGVRKAQNKIFGEYGTGQPVTGYGDSGSAARFFQACPFDEEDAKVAVLTYCAKATPTERGAGTSNVNKHCTVKPLSLMRYLTKLVTPPGGIVLDPFAGSGTTWLAAKQEGFVYIGMEREPEYFVIACGRLK